MLEKQNLDLFKLYILSVALLEVLDEAAEKPNLSDHLKITGKKLRRKLDAWMLETPIPNDPVLLEFIAISTKELAEIKDLHVQPRLRAYMYHMVEIGESIGIVSSANLKIKAFNKAVIKENLECGFSPEYVTNVTVHVGKLLSKRVDILSTQIAEAGTTNAAV